MAAEATANFDRMVSDNAGEAEMTKLMWVVGLSVFVAGCVASDRGKFGMFERSLNIKSHGYAVVDDPTGSAPTAKVERFEVRPGDCGVDSGWSDCANDRERSELSQTSGRVSGGEIWYGWSFYFPQDYPNIFPAKTALGQFHQTRSYPIWMIQHQSDGLYLDRQTSAGSQDLYPLIAEAMLRGKWHKVEIHARWSRNFDGFFRVWINGEQKVNYAGRTFYGSDTYFKFGVYRSFLSRATTKPAAGQTVLYANVRAADTREGLAPPPAK